MSDGTPIYGISRGYRGLTVVSFLALVVSITLAFQSSKLNIVAAIGALAFGALFGYSSVRSRRRHVLFTIGAEGLTFVDPAVPLGIVRWDEFQSVRIFATTAHPVVGFALRSPTQVRKRLPMLMRLTVGPFWSIHEYAFTFQLDNLDDQVASISSAAGKHGIPVISELV